MSNSQEQRDLGDSTINTYAKAGVNTALSDEGVAAIVNVLNKINTGEASRSIMPSGAYAAVLTLTPELALAITTDGVGSKILIAEELQRFDTIGIDCVAMNVNDIICVGATPIALVDYIAVESTDSQMLSAIAQGLKQGAELAGIEIPAGELAVLPEIIRGHPSPFGFDLVGTCIGTVNPSRVITGRNCQPGDVIIGIPSSGLHSNGYTLARKVLCEQGGLRLDETISELGHITLGDELMRPTTIYVQAIVSLLKTIPVKGLAHITGGGLNNLLRLSPEIGIELLTPLPVLPIFSLIQEIGAVSKKEMWEVFNMGCGFCVVVAEEYADRTIQTLTEHHPGSSRIGVITGRSE